MAKRDALSRAVANFNRRITREIARNPSAAEYLPDKQRARDIRQGIASASERQRVIKEFNRFQAPQMARVITHEKGFQTTQWELASVRRYNERANLARQRELAVRAAAAPDFISKAGEIEKTRLKPRTPHTEKLPPTEHAREAWRAFAKAERHVGSERYYERKLEDYKSAYIKRIRKELGRAGASLAAKLEKMPAAKIYENQFGDPLRNFSMIASPKTNKSELAAMVSEHWNLESDLD